MIMASPSFEYILDAKSLYSIFESTIVDNPRQPASPVRTCSLKRITPPLPCSIPVTYRIILFVGVSAKFKASFYLLLI